MAFSKGNDIEKSVHEKHNAGIEEEVFEGKEQRWTDTTGHYDETGEVTEGTVRNAPKKKGIPWKWVCNILMLFLVFFLLSMTISSNSRIGDLKGTVSSLRQELREQRNMVNFVNKYVVFIEDDGTGYYHTYNCSDFKGESFWAFNIDSAIDEGYTPCQKCH